MAQRGWKKMERKMTKGDEGFFVESDSITAVLGKLVVSTPSTHTSTN